MTKELKNVVIVGGGAAGSVLARDLSKKLKPSGHKLILITERPYYVHLLAMARLIVTGEKDLANNALIGYDNLFYNGNGEVKIGKVVSIEGAAGKGGGGEVLLENEERVPYAILVLATGCTWPAAIEIPRKVGVSRDDAHDHLSNWKSKFEQAKHIVVVGGGAVGIELAGELRDAYTAKKVTLVHRDKMLLNEVYPDKFRKDIERRVRKRNIDLILGDSIEASSGDATDLKTVGGKSLADADLIVNAFGSTPNTSFIRDSPSFGESTLDNGYVKVNEYLEVQNHPGVFAIGDIIKWKNKKNQDEQKQLAKVNAQVAVVSANTLNFLVGEPLSKKYAGSPEMIVIPLGKSGGSGYVDLLWGIMMGDRLTRMLKGNDLFVTQTRKALGVV